MKRLFLLIAFAMSLGWSVAQQAITLGIGDPAPSIKYSKWLKGTPVDTYRDDHIYVLEFWATWCGPCIAAMPHLSELAKKYEKEATFIGVNVLEKTGDQPYESSLPAVTRFVNGSGNRMSYDVVADNNAQDMNNSWLKPAGIYGIPTTFVVRRGQIVWIGHPIKLDSVMQPIIDGSFDVASFKKEYELRSKASQSSMNEMREAFAAVQKAVDAKDYDGAFRSIDEGIQKVPILKISLRLQKFKILLDHFPEAEARKYAEELDKEGSSYTGSIGSFILEKEGLSRDMYLFAAACFKKMLDQRSFSALYDRMALAYSKAGDMKEAAAAQEKAIAAAKAEVKDPTFGGRVFEHTITDYEATLKKYRGTSGK